MIVGKASMAQLDAAVRDVKAPAAGLRATQAAPQLGWLVLWMSGSVVFFIVGAISVRALARSLSVFEMMSVRCAGSLLILGAFAAASSELRAGLKFRRMGLQGVRGVVHFGSQI